jgi:hypothetical protein
MRGREAGNMREGNDETEAVGVKGGERGRERGARNMREGNDETEAVRKKGRGREREGHGT